MKRTVHVIFDGEVLRPQEPLALKPNGRYRVTIEDEPGKSAATGTSGLFLRVLERARDLGIPDLAEQHDHYLYGLPKREV